MRRLVGSPWYQRAWGDRVVISSNQDTQHRYSTEAGGARIATSVDGIATGEHIDVQTCDDPIKAGDVHYKVRREEVITWWDQTMASRLRKGGSRVVIMQRLHEGDLAGVLLRRGNYEHLCLPAEYEPTTRVTKLGFKDPRTEPGELLWPEMFSREVHEQRKIEMGNYAVAGQLQQRPAPEGGGILRPDWFKRYKPADLPARFDYVEATVDAAFEKGEDNDYVAVGVWGVCGVNAYLLHVLRRKMGYVETKRALLGLATGSWNDSSVGCWRIEKKANGAALIDELSQKLKGVVAYSPTESKIARAHAASPAIEAGNVLIPEEAPWVGDFLAEMESFPNGDHDDQVDMTTMFINNARNHFLTGFALAEELEFDVEAGEFERTMSGFD